MVIKWPGGKRWLAKRLAPILQEEIGSNGTYFEPFFGGGAVFFEMRPKKAYLTDSNCELIHFWTTLRERPHAVEQAVSKLRNSHREYYRIRSSQPVEPIARAARFLYLSRTAWGGIYRLNQNGDFNVPFGNSGRSVIPRIGLKLAADALGCAKLKCCDFEKAIARARKGDVVYMDPPYISERNEMFRRYNGLVFTLSDYDRLAECCAAARKRGVFLVLSVAAESYFERLFKGWNAIEVQRWSAVSKLASKRKGISELLLFSAPNRRTDIN